MRSPETAETAWVACQPVCECLPKPLMAEDGKTGLPQDVKVKCSGNTCQTYF